MEDHLIVRADEVDQTGADIAPRPDEQLLPGVTAELDAEKRAAKRARAALAATGPTPPGPTAATTATPEAFVPEKEEKEVSDVSQPQPSSQSAATGANQSARTDSLSLAQLRRLVQDLPRGGGTSSSAGSNGNPPVAAGYTFVYADTQSLAAELDEWFRYDETDRMMLLGARASFDQAWSPPAACSRSASISAAAAASASPASASAALSAAAAAAAVSPPMPTWPAADDNARIALLKPVLDEGLRQPDLFARVEALEILCYIVTGVWATTASGGQHEEQLEWIDRNVRLVHRCGGVVPLFDCLRAAFAQDEGAEPSVGADVDADSAVNAPAAYAVVREREANLVLTVTYIFVEIARRQAETGETGLRDDIAEQPDLLAFFTGVIARLRWQDDTPLPLTRLVLLFHKAVLLLWGGTDALSRAKEVLGPDSWEKNEHGGGGQDPNSGANLEPHEHSQSPPLTASPLDYHLFRQEVSSKYPAYNPPPPLVPVEIGHNSILPPFPTISGRYSSTPTLFSGVGPAATTPGSIINQSVHIATPAPSPPPPPAPVGPGGKVGKKQNYQTSPHFPFMYPPLDRTSNDIGGKGSGGLQDNLVGKQWDGGDVPASIVEAGLIFSSRMKLTRSTRQLWDARERFMRYERGWRMADKENNEPDLPPDDDTRRTLIAVEQFYAAALPSLQSLVIVLLKELLVNVSDAVAAQQSSGPATTDFEFDGDGDELEATRAREITAKGISGLLLLMLKWFKRSHILKFEYMTQLLLDYNYIPLILKIFFHGDVDRTVAQKNDRDDQSFFHFCHLHSDNPPSPSDDAIPPPIARSRSDPDARPEVDELGFPTASSPTTAISTYSFRNFYSAINFLHILQKITRGKTHRALLLVQYKSAAILRKGLRVPDERLRRYTLKLFKSQVPFCSRKWRQSHMRVITAIYLHCRPGLREDWLAPADVDADVDEAQPMEEALRGLTHWWHVREYRGVMAGGTHGGGGGHHGRQRRPKGLNDAGDNEAGEPELPVSPPISDHGSISSSDEDDGHDFFRRELLAMRGGWGDTAEMVEEEEEEEGW